MLNCEKLSISGNIILLLFQNVPQILGKNPLKAGSVGLVHSAFGFCFEGEQTPGHLVLRWVTAWVLDSEACLTHWTGFMSARLLAY